MGDAVELKNAGGGTLAKFNWRRVGSTSTYILESTETNFPNAVTLQIAFIRPAGATYFRVTDFVVTEGGVPQVIPGGMTSSQVGDIAEEVAQDVVSAAISALPIGKPATALAALAMAATRRVDFVMMGDSNQLMDGRGFDYALARGLAERFGCYASPILRPGGVVAGLTEDQAAHLMIGGVGLFAAAGGIVEGNTGSSIGPVGSAQRNLIDPRAVLRAWYGIYEFAAAGGQYRPGFRLEVAPFTTAVDGGATSTEAAEAGYALKSLAIPAGAGRSGSAYAFKFRLPAGGSAINGPFLGYFSRIENEDASSGVSVHTLYGAGGQSLYDMAAWIMAEPDARLANWFAEVRRLQLSRGLSPIIVVYINSGLNDRNETSSPSLG